MFFFQQLVQEVFRLLGACEFQGACLCLDTMRLNTGEEDQSFQRSETAEGNINLAGRERGACIDDGFFKSEALAFVNGDGPCQSNGVLRR